MARPLTARERVIFLVCLAMIFVYGGYNFIFRAIKDEIVRLGSQIEVKERKVKKNLEIIAEERVIDEEYGQYADYLKQIGNAMGKRIFRADEREIRLLSQCKFLDQIKLVIVSDLKNV